MLSPSSTLPTETVQGTDLKRIARAASPSKGALLAADLEAGRIVVERPTPRQARALTGASVSYQYVARKLSPMDRSAVRFGRLVLSKLARQQRELTDAKLDRLVARIGAEGIMAALDRVTSPQRAAAE